MLPKSLPRVQKLQGGALKPLPEENSADVSLQYIDPKGVLYELEFPINEAMALLSFLKGVQAEIRK